MFYWHMAQDIANERHAEARRWRLVRVARSARRHERQRSRAVSRRDSPVD